jgi:hypothetical protein
MDNDSAMLQQMGSALTSLQLKFKMSSIDDRAVLRPSLMELMQDFAVYQTKLLKDGVVSTESDIAEMKEIRSKIDAAGEKQSMLVAIGRVIGFVAARI